MRKSDVKRTGVDLIGREARSKAQIYIVAKGGKSRHGKAYSDSEVFARVAKAIYSLAQVYESGILGRGDKTAFAVPDMPVFRKYLSFLGSRVSPFFFVADEKKVITIA